MSRRVIAGVGGLVIAGVLAGCTSSGPDPTPLPTATVEPTTAAPTPDPEPTEALPEEPVMPLPRTGTPDERDAEAAAQYFVELYEYTLTTGDLETWDARSMEGCGFCSGTAEDVRSYGEDGLTYRGGAVEIANASFVSFGEVFRLFAVEVELSLSPAELVDAHGDVVRMFRSSGGFLLLEIGYSPETGWMLRTGNLRDESVL